MNVRKFAWLFATSDAEEQAQFINEIAAAFDMFGGERDREWKRDMQLCFICDYLNPKGREWIKGFALSIEAEQQGMEDDTIKLQSRLGGLRHEVGELEKRAAELKREIESGVEE